MNNGLTKAEKEVLRERLKSEKAVLKALEKQYETALEEIDDKIAALLGRNDANLPNVIHQVQYQRLIKAQVKAALDRLHSGEYETIEKYLQDSYTDGFVGTMYSLHRQDVPVIIPIEQEAAIKAVTIDSKLKEPLYESLGVDVGKLKKTISAEITRGIAAGYSYDEIARGIALMTKAPLSRARTIVRTEAGRVQEQANFDAANKSKAAGADVVKQWSAILDGKTRDTHRELDHQIRELDKPFEIHGKKAMHPHDFDDPAEDCNCRCTMLTRARWALDEDELKVMQERAEFFGLDKTDSFAEFKEKYLKAAAEIGPETNPIKAVTVIGTGKPKNQPVEIQQVYGAPTALEKLEAEEKRLNTEIGDINTEIENYKKMLDENQKNSDASDDFTEWIRLGEEEEQLRAKIKAAEDKLRKAREEIENVKKEKPWAPYSEPYFKARTPQEVANVLRKKAYFSTDKVNMEGLSLDGAQTVATALDRCFSEYPEMTGKIKGITISKRNSGGASFNNVTGMLEIGQDFFGGSIDEMRKAYAKMVRSGYAPQGCDYRGILVHEFGHAIDQRLSGKNALASGTYYGDFLRDVAGFKSSMSKGVSDYIREHVSRYADVSPIECFAECFNEYVCSSKPREMASWYGKRIDQFFGKAAQTVENTGISGIIEKGKIAIPVKKLTGYALDPKKAPDKAKAFKLALGYDQSNADELLQNIVDHVDESKFVEKGNVGYGMLYQSVVRLTGPNGKQANVLTAWIDENGKKRLTSVYVTDKKVTE